MNIRPGVDFGKHLEKLVEDMKYIDAQERVTRLDVTACYVAAKVCVSEFVEAVSEPVDDVPAIFEVAGLDSEGKYGAGC